MDRISVRHLILSFQRRHRAARGGTVAGAGLQAEARVHHGREGLPDGRSRHLPALLLRRSPGRAAGHRRRHRQGDRRDGMPQGQGHPGRSCCGAAICHQRQGGADHRRLVPHRGAEQGYHALGAPLSRPDGGLFARRDQFGRRLHEGAGGRLDPGQSVDRRRQEAAGREAAALPDLAGGAAGPAGRTHHRRARRLLGRRAGAEAGRHAGHHHQGDQAGSAGRRLDGGRPGHAADVQGQ